MTQRTITDYLATFPNITEMQRAILVDCIRWIETGRTKPDLPRKTSRWD